MVNLLVLIVQSRVFNHCMLYYVQVHVTMNVTSYTSMASQRSGKVIWIIAISSMGREYNNDGGKILRKCLITEEISFIDNLYSCLVSPSTASVKLSRSL